MLTSIQSKLVIIGMVALLGNVILVWAGELNNDTVEVDPTQGAASGVLSNAAFGANDTQIGCDTNSVRNPLTGELTTSVFCQATDAEGEALSCTSTDPNVVSVVEGLNDNSRLSFGVDSDGTCQEMTVAFSSAFVPVDDTVLASAPAPGSDPSLEQVSLSDLARDPRFASERADLEELQKAVGEDLTLALPGEVTANAVTASVSLQFGQLTIIGDAQDNVINISRATDGEILINNGQVAVVGGTPTVNNTNTILALGLGGNDQLTLNEFNGALPRAFLLGGSGNDLLIGGAGQDYLSGSTGNDTIRGAGNVDQLFGGSGNDVLLGDRGNDTVQGQIGSDLLIWNNGDGSDFLEGGDGNDFVQVNGANGAGDDFSVSLNGQRARFQRDNLGLFTLDIGTTENLDVNGQGGDDQVRVNDLISTNLQTLDIDGGDGSDIINAFALQPGLVFIARGGTGNDIILAGAGNDIVLGEAGRDLVFTGNGRDFVAGGAGNDLMAGGNGNDALLGGTNDDVLLGGNGNDFLNGDAGFDTLNGGPGQDIGVNGESVANIP